MKAQNYDSMKQAAAMEGFPLQWLKKAKNAGCIGFVGSRVQIAPVKKWIEENHDSLITNDGSMGEKIKEEQHRKLKIANDRQAKLLVQKAKVTQFFHAFSGEFRSALTQLFTKEAPMATAGMDVPQTAVVLERYVDRLIEIALRYESQLENID